MVKPKSIFSILLVSVTVAMCMSFQKPSSVKSSVEPIRKNQAYSTLTDIIITETDYNDISPTLQIVLKTGGGIEPQWWRASISIHMYFFGGGTPYQNPNFPYNWIQTWGWGYRTYQAEIAPGQTEYETDWGVQQYDRIDGQYTLLSWGSE